MLHPAGAHRCADVVQREEHGHALGQFEEAFALGQWPRGVSRRPPWGWQRCAKAANLKAPGPSGWTEELLLLACRSSAQVLDELSAILADILAGKVGPAARQLLCACRIVAIPKGDDEIRPRGYWRKPPEIGRGPPFWFFIF